MYIYARINKNTLKFIREKKEVSFNYITKITKYSKEKISLWEDESVEKLPTINQAKSIAKCYRIPFAGLYMNSTDINVKHLPTMRNLRTLPDANIDNSALNLAIADVLNARELLIETKKELKEQIPSFSLANQNSTNVSVMAQTIRNAIGLTSDIQYKCASSRKLYLFIRNSVENCGIFVHCFTGVEVDNARGFAIYDDILPIIGLNNDDRYPAKTFSIIHELVHLLRRSSAICNEIMGSFSSQSEEVFCNAVAGETLVPKNNLLRQIGNRTPIEIDLTFVEKIANHFSVSKEVICRRLLDLGKISQTDYNSFSSAIKTSFENEREQMREYRKITGKGIPRNIPRETIDKNSTALCRTFYNGFREGYFDKQDISRYLGIKQNHIDKFMWEVAKW